MSDLYRRVIAGIMAGIAHYPRPICEPSPIRYSDVRHSSGWVYPNPEDNGRRHLAGKQTLARMPPVGGFGTVRKLLHRLFLENGPILAIDQSV